MWLAVIWGWRSSREWELGPGSVCSVKKASARKDPTAKPTSQSYQITHSHAFDEEADTTAPRLAFHEYKCNAAFWLAQIKAG